MSGPLPQQPPPGSAKLPQLRVKRATVASVSSQLRATTAQALKGYAYLKSHSSRNRSHHPLLRTVATADPTAIRRRLLSLYRTPIPVPLPDHLIAGWSAKNHKFRCIDRPSTEQRLHHARLVRATNGVVQGMPVQRVVELLQRLSNDSF